MTDMRYQKFNVNLDFIRRKFLTIYKVGKDFVGLFDDFYHLFGDHLLGK